ncbi:hypothetical protein E2C01_013892 [Portunus trituberculatus]|uniref:Uncharacterized protein n=1 Tax=Portunus trituberculatus TaxID=210409 RepID=A0A5B7DHS8_PORTR|nr:hypothetical protein [Portunus trituberculatus]
MLHCHGDSTISLTSSPSQPTQGHGCIFLPHALKNATVSPDTWYTSSIVGGTKPEPLLLLPGSALVPTAAPLYTADHTLQGTLDSFLYDDFLMSSVAPSGHAGTMCNR